MERIVKDSTDSVMKYVARQTWTRWAFVTALTAVPVAAQLGLGNATSSIGGMAQGTARASIAQSAGGIAGPGAGVRPELNASSAISQNTVLTARIGSLVPATTTPAAAEAGFRSDSDFVTTLHAAHNLNIPFEDLKAQTTGKGAVSLNRAIRKLRPDLDSKDVKENETLAAHQSERDLQQSAQAGARDRVAQRVTSDDRLAARLNTMVPPGQSLREAAAGFKSEDQFMATLHAANSNGLPFNDLKDRVTAGQSLGTAIHDMKPTMDANTSAHAAADAEAQSRNDKIQASASAKASASASAR